MSGIAAIIRFDDQAVEPGQIEAMTAAMACRGPDGISHHTAGPVALGHCQMHATAESLEEVQPLASEDGSLILVMDGWLSNWEELRALLLARGAVLRSRSDAELVLRAYEAWGDECPAHIDGEYAFVIWDGRRGEAFMARDHAGLRPLHYHLDGHRLVAASDIAAVLAGPDVRQVPNMGMVAEIVAADWISADETVWQGVLRAPPAHWMRFGREGIASGEYWSPPLEVSLPCRSDADYVAQYHAMFADCVRRCSRTHLPVAAAVSGGLDSSAIFAMAHDLARRGELPAAEIKGYTYQAPAGDPADELAFARDVAAHVGVKVREVPLFLPELDWFKARMAADRDAAPYPNTAMGVELGRALVADGCRVLLNGEGGDEWLTGKPFYYAEQLQFRDWGALRRSLRSDVAAYGWRAAMRLLLRYGLVYALPQWLRSFVGRRRGAAKGGEADWLSPELRGLLTARRAAKRPTYARIANLPSRAMYMELQNNFGAIMRDHLSRQCAQTGFEPRYPMFSRRFMEFAFSTPEHLRLRGGVTKWIHRQALADLLPESVAKRTSKGEFSLAFAKHLGNIMFPEYELLTGTDAGNYRSRVVSPDGMGRLYQRYLDTSAGEKPIWELWGAFMCIELFALADVASNDNATNGELR
ncbi:MAG: asparagine synthase-related protein [Novosphingobium sp.]